LRKKSGRAKIASLALQEQMLRPERGCCSRLLWLLVKGRERKKMQGRPFVGKAGQLLDKMLASIELSRTSNCFIANTVKCRPPFNRDPTPEERITCLPFLKRQIKLLKPKMILVTGKVAAHSLLNTTEPIGKLREKFYELTVGQETYPFLVTYHPAALLRTDEYKRPAWEDLKLLRSKIS
jgi:DNA polymerase